jgi:hypothetical protein
LNIYNDTTKGFLAFLLRIKEAHTNGLLGCGVWGETGGKRADIINEWCVVAGEKKMYVTTFELINDVISKLSEVTLEEIDAIGNRIQAKNINTQYKRFYMTEFLKEAEVKKTSAEILLDMTDEELGEFVEDVPVVEEKPVAKKPTAKRKTPAKKVVKKD